MRAESKLIAFVKTITAGRWRVVTEVGWAARKPLTTEDTPEQDRYKPERYLESMRHSLPML